VVVVPFVVLVGLIVWESRQRGLGMYNHDNLKVSVERGDAIVLALEEWRGQHDNFPDSLDALVPEFLPKVLRPTAGRPLRWRYHTRDDGAGFTLSFGWSMMFVQSENEMYPYCGYSQRAWHCEEARVAGEPIAAALEAWRAEHAEFPELLSELSHEGEGSWAYRRNWAMPGYRLTFNGCLDVDSARCMRKSTRGPRCDEGKCGHRKPPVCRIYHGWYLDN
jgi:hypothetical protein